MNNNVVNIENGTSNFIPLKVKDRAGKYNVPNAPMPTVEVKGNSGTLKMLPNYAYFAKELSSITIELVEDNEENYMSSYYLMFESGDTPTDITFPKGLKYGDEEDNAYPEIEANKTYELSILNKCVAIKSYAENESEKSFYKLTKHTDVEDSDICMIIGISGNNAYALSSENEESDNPPLVPITRETDGSIKNIDIADTLKWKIKKAENNNYTISPVKQSTRLYADNSNNVFVGESVEVWKLEINNLMSGYHGLQSVNANKFLVFDDLFGHNWSSTSAIVYNSSDIEIFVLK